MKVDSNISAMSILPWSKSFPSEAVTPEMGNILPKKNEQTNKRDQSDQESKLLVTPGTHIQVKIHEKTNTIMVLVKDDKTQEVIREIPREKMLDLMYNMCVQSGVFLDKKM